MEKNTIGKRFLSELKLYSDYMKWNEDFGRYETWEEACEDVLKVHRTRYGEKVNGLIDEVLPFYKEKAFLASQRSLQFRNEQLLKNNCKLYNCSVAYCYSPDIFKKGFFMLLSGAGFGVNLKKKYVSQLPLIHKKVGDDTITFVIPDSIEGWADAENVLISSYCLHPSLDNQYFGKRIRFDYSQIRPEGAYITGGFKAPGHKGLQTALELIEALLEKELENQECISFRSFIAYNIFMYSSDAVLSGGVRRSSMDIIMNEDDEEMVYAKTGDWRQRNPHFARSNNSIGLLKGSFTKERLEALLAINVGDNDCGVVLLESEDELFNPCFEIGFDFYNKIKDYNFTVIQMCNLTEINASFCKNKKGELDKEKFFRVCRASSIVGTLQAGFADFPYLGKETEEIVRGEALLGVSITGWMDNPGLFNPEVLQEGARIVIETNKEVAELIGINEAARTTCVKPSGNASVILGTASGIHAEHSVRFFRIMQLNKENEVAKWLLSKYPEMLEESSWSKQKTDYVVYVPIENDGKGIYKDNLSDIRHLELIELVQKYWVKTGKNPKNAYNPNINHNVSNTVIVDDREKVVDYIYNNQENFVALSFMSRLGDKDFNQAPFTSIYTHKELVDKYGEGVIFTSGLIVDGLHCFDNNLWQACNCITNTDISLHTDREKSILQKDWLRRVKKFSKNYFENDIKNTIYCIKDVYLYHKWCTISRIFKTVPDLSSILQKPEFIDINTTGAKACSGNQCEI